MSRSSAGFADFFPTAPSVIQQKRFKATKERQRSRTLTDKEHIDGGHTIFPGSRLVQEAVSGDASLEPIAEPGKSRKEPVGDGMMSPRETSTPIINSSGPGTGSSNDTHLETLTPLTNVESSPHHKLSPSHPKVSNGAGMGIYKELSADDTKATMTPLHTPPTPNQSQKRGAGIIRGCKLVYDPDKVPSKDKRKKPCYVDIVANEQDQSVTDPRLKIPNYSRGAGCRQKTKYRPAPYVLKPWPYDPATTVGPGPPIQIVITGYDPLTPLAPISALFSSFGEISEMNNRTDPITGRFLGICSVKYKDSSSFRGGGPLPAAAAAKCAYYECRKGQQRIGNHRIKVDLDRDGVISRKLVQRVIEAQRMGSGSQTPAAMDEPKPDVELKTNEPPPTAPKGPSGKSSMRPSATIPEGPRANFTKPAMQSFVEETPILSQIKRDPYPLHHAENSQI